MRTAKTAISEVTIAGKARYRVTYQSPTGRKREHFTRKADAEKRLKAILQDQKMHGIQGEVISQATRVMASEAEKALAGTGITLADAVKIALADHARKTGGIPIQQAIQHFLDSRCEMSDGYRATLQGRLKIISGAWAGRTTASITRKDCQDLLDGLAGTYAPQTVKHYQTHLHALLAHWQGQGWSSSNAADDLRAAKVKREEIGILTATELAELFANCPPSILPEIVLQAFCGLRAAEAARVEWSAVSLAEGHVIIGAAVAKTGSRRVCPLPPAAVAWLRPYAKDKGKVRYISTACAEEAWRLARVKAGFGPIWTDSPAIMAEQAKVRDWRPWPHNGLRHSAISYKVASSSNLAQVAYESGNSPAILQAHYNELATPAQAAAWFAITPDAPANVLPMTATS